MINILLDAIIIFGIGAVCMLIALAVILGVQHYRSIKKRRAHSAAQLKNAHVLNQHLDMLAELNLRQQEISAKIEEPSKNALHSKHKNLLIQAVREIEEEKFTIMMTILLLGYDPTVMYVNEKKERVEMKMSDYVNLLYPQLAQTRSQPQRPTTLRLVPNKSDPPKTKSDFKYYMRPRLRLIKGGKAETNK